MPSDFWEEMSEDSSFSWDEVDHIHVHRGNGEWEVMVELENGEIESLDDSLTDEQMEEYFWNDLYFWAMEWDVGVDKEIEYGEAT
jgi:hypothetical protein